MKEGRLFKREPPLLPFRSCLSAELFRAKNIAFFAGGGTPPLQWDVEDAVPYIYISFLSSQYSHSRRVSSPPERKLLGRYSSWLVIQRGLSQRTPP